LSGKRAGEVVAECIKCGRIRPLIEVFRKPEEAHTVLRKPKKESKITKPAKVTKKIPKKEIKKETKKETKVEPKKKVEKSPAPALKKRGRKKGSKNKSKKNR